MSRPLVVSCACACWLALSACDTGPPRPNIVLYVVDTLRADRLTLYGHDQDTSPNIDALGASGIVYEQANAPAPWTLPSVTSLLLSQLPCEHGVTVDRDRIADSARPLAAILKENGYRTASFHANPYAGKMTGLEAGYDNASLVRQPDLFGRVAAWLGRVDTEPFFLYVHSVEPHNPELAVGSGVPQSTLDTVETRYRAYRTLTRVDWDEKQPLGTTDNTDEQVQALSQLSAIRGAVLILYDAAVRNADGNVGKVIKVLEERGFWENTLFVLVSDHGEELGDRGGWLHDQSVYDELIRVPLVIRYPEDEGAGTRVTEPVGLIDVVPTVLDYLEIDAPSSVRGRSLRGGVSAEPRFLAFRENRKKHFRPYVELRGDQNVVVRRGGWKGIWNVDNDTVELYDVANDPSEIQLQNVREPERADAVRAFGRVALERCRALSESPGTPTEIELSPEERRQLEALGYLDSSQ